MLPSRGHEAVVPTPHCELLRAAGERLAGVGLRLKVDRGPAIQRG
jgi:hypothetical protein